MLHIKVNDAELLFDEKEAWLMPGQTSADVVKLSPHSYHLLINNKSYRVELLERSSDGKTQTLLINGKKVNAQVKDRYDELLEQLGLDKKTKGGASEVKAPMPGLVLRIQVKAGDAVKKGDTLIVLEAMKMENVIKAADDCVVKKVVVSEKNAVEKNQVLMELE